MPLKKWKKQHFICSYLTSFIVPFFLSFFLFLFFFLFFFFLFPWGRRSPSPLNWRPLERTDQNTEWPQEYSWNLPYRCWNRHGWDQQALLWVLHTYLLTYKRCKTSYLTYLRYLLSLLTITIAYWTYIPLTELSRVKNVSYDVFTGSEWMTTCNC